ncbi:hypothetical protein NGH30_07205 [Macrococcus caseolyticus]|uniref:hypothetical protein n=1 Tax=Macrococcoides caseolyticum TaxID=69966 RepID=UPI002DB904B4|nr:hypothetical protein [Macrococcus caseolyticus]MEB8171622.1 hypothetical protein [Macrococcus caseolyticus]
MDKNISKEIAKNYSFKDIEEAIQIKRSQERMKIINLLRKERNDENDLVVFSTGGYGSSKYKGNSKDINYSLKQVPYDLRNWICIEGSYKYEERYWHYIITLQCLEQDKTSLNWHCLINRIGIMVDEIDESEHIEAKRKINKIQYEYRNIYSYCTYKISDWKKSLTSLNLPIDNLNIQDLMDELYSEKHRIQSFD